MAANSSYFTLFSSYFFRTFAPNNLNNVTMKKFLLSILIAMPLMAAAQDNTWERIEQEPVDSSNPDAKYLAPNAVPEVDGIVCWETIIDAPGKSASEIYDIILAQMEKMVNEPNQIANSAVAVKDKEKYELGAVFHEWLVFKSSFLALDRTQMNFQLIAWCSDGKVKLHMKHVTYDYDLDRKPLHYQAEKWITDKYSVNKKHTKLYPVSAKFRRKTIDRKNFIFNKIKTLLNN